MSHRRRSVPFVLAIAGLAALSGVFADTAMAEDDDFDFAQALYQRGYTDLAEEKFTELINDSKRSASEKAAGQYGLGLLKAYNARIAALEDRSRLRLPLPDVLKLFDEADAALDNFISRNPNHDRTLEAKLDRSKLITDRADYINRAIENGWVPADVTEEALMKRIADGYDAALRLLRDLKAEAKKELEKLSPSDDGYGVAEDKLGIVWLFEIQALYGKGAALPRGDAAGEGALNTALDEIAEFMWIYDGTVRGLWAFHFSSLVYWKLDKPTDALRDMRDAAHALTAADGVPAGRAITMLSFQKLADIAIEMRGRHEGPDTVTTALETFEKLPQNWPRYMDHRNGQLAALAHARLLAQAGRGAEAIEEVQQVLKKAQATGTRTDKQAGEVLAELLGSAGNVKLDPELLSKVAGSKWADDDARGAIRAYQAVTAACSTQQEWDQYGWPAWKRIGEGYVSLGRWYEAYLAFDVIEQAWAKDESNEVLSDMTNETAYGRAYAISKLAQQLQDADPVEAKRLDEWSKQMLEDFATDHPDSPRNEGIEVKVAATKRGEMIGLIRGGDAEGGLAKLAEVRTALQAIQPEIDSYDKATAWLADLHRWEARCHAELGDTDKAVAAFSTCIAEAEKWLNTDRPAATQNAVRRNRKNGQNICLTAVLQSHARKADALVDRPDDRRKAFEELLAALAKYETDYVEAVRGGEGRVREMRIEALIGTGDVQKSDELVSDLTAGNPSLPNGPYLAALVAKAREAEAWEWQKKGSQPQFIAGMTRAAKLREYAVTEQDTRTGGKTSAAAWLSLAQTFRHAEIYEKADEYYRKALDAYETAGNDEQARAVRLALIGLLIDQGKFDEAVPLLEQLLVADAAARAPILERLGDPTPLRLDEVQTMLETMSRTKAVLDELSRAYLQGARDTSDVIRSINLCSILRFAHPKDSKHDAEYVRFMVRLAQGYYKLGVDEGQPEALKNVVNIVQNLDTLGLLDTYDEQQPGSKRLLTELMSKAKSRL